MGYFGFDIRLPLTTFTFAPIEPRQQTLRAHAPRLRLSWPTLRKLLMQRGGTEQCSMRAPLQPQRTPTGNFILPHKRTPFLTCLPGHLQMTHLNSPPLLASGYGTECGPCSAPDPLRLSIPTRFTLSPSNVCECVRHRAFSPALLLR